MIQNFSENLTVVYSICVLRNESRTWRHSVV